LPLHPSLTDPSSYPHTVNFCIKRQMQIDSYMELPKDKRPPEEIWDDPERLETWFDDVFDFSKPNSVELVISDIEG